jgi:GPH family glycoside/pentoside/hexuronide:cation symporter
LSSAARSADPQAPLPPQAPPPSSGEGERVPRATLLAWGPPIFGASSALFFLQFFFLKFATDVLMIAPVVVGALFAAGRLWDAVSDPLVGTLSDRTRTRIGRRRPWMFAAIPLLVAFTWMIWTPPADLTGTLLVVWVGVALFGFYTAFTFYMIPHLSLGAELTPNHHDRTRIFGVHAASFSLGMVFAFSAMQVVMNSADQRSSARSVAILLCLGMAVILVIPPLRVREKADHLGRGAQSPLHAMRDVFRNADAVRLLAVQFVAMVGVSVIGLLSPYIVQYVLKRPELVGPLPALFLIFNIGSIPVWVRLSQRYGKRDTWLASMVLAGIGFGLMALAGEGDVLLLVCLLPLVGFANGCGGVVANSIMADVIDGDELQTGERKEGAYNSAFGLAVKTANAFMILMTGLALQLLDFEPGAEQTASVKLGLRLLYGVLPFTMFMAAAWVLRGLRIDEAGHARIRAGLADRADAKREGRSSAADVEHG